MPVGPLTNIAAAVTLAPEIVDAVDEIVIMGGSASHGNETSQAEFNIFEDPVAAHVVVNAGFERLTLVTLDATRKARVSAAQCRELEALGTPGATATAQILDYYIRGNSDKALGSAAVHDALCIAYLLDPSVIESARLHVGVDTVGFHTYGRTLDRPHRDRRHRRPTPPSRSAPTRRSSSTCCAPPSRPSRYQHRPLAPTRTEALL